MDGGPPLSTLVNDLLAYTRASMEEFGPLPVALDPRSSRQVVVNQWVVSKRQTESRSHAAPLFRPPSAPSWCRGHLSPCAKYQYYGLFLSFYRASPETSDSIIREWTALVLFFCEFI